ncbi:hypothetical protein, partial [Amphritea pacifica]|uniref:hypothetical protein n=1 Tax=Amphritea pacifica TaxID=2811233 RepID=UPI001963FABD
MKHNKGETHWDENQCAIGSLNRWGLIYFYITMFAKGGIVIIGPMFILTIIAFVILDDWNFVDVSEVIYNFTLSIFLPSGLIWGYAEASEHGYLPMPWFMKAVKHFSFSRSTGMVTR